jgi:hypothetical protein
MGAREEQEIAKIAKMTLPERIEAAKAKTEKVVDHLSYLIKLHENNALVLYSPLLSSQIPTSHAANAFFNFRAGLHQIELVRLCSLWDSVDLKKENVPTIIELIDQSDVVEALAKEAASPWENLEREDKEYGEQRTQKARTSLPEAIKDARAIMGSSHLQSIMNLRDKHLAHSLTETWREKAGPIAPMKYGDERVILEATLPIVEALHCWVNDGSFSFNDSREIDRKNAKALWEGCKFTIEY